MDSFGNLDLRNSLFSNEKIEKLNRLQNPIPKR